MTLFSLIAKLTVDKTGFDAGLNAAQRRVSQFGAALKSQLAAAFSVAAITAYTRSLIQYASKVKDASTQTGASMQSLQTLGHAAKQTGSDFEAVVRSMKDLSKARQEALDKPGSQAAQVFEALGISGQKLKDLKLDELFRAIGRGFERNDFGASELAMVTKLLGRAGGELLPLFKEGVDALEITARNAGAALRDPVLLALDEVGNTLDNIQAQLRGPFSEAIVFALTQANALLKALEGGFRLAVKFTVGFKRGFKEGPEFTKEDIPFGPFGVGRLMSKLLDRLFGGIEAGSAKAMADLAIQEIGLPGLGGGGILGGLINALLGHIGVRNRPKREFNFEELLKERAQPRARLIRDDALGRIGGGVGGGDAVQTKLTEMVRELKELRRTIQFRGVRIDGEL